MPLIQIQIVLVTLLTPSLIRVSVVGSIQAIIATDKLRKNYDFYAQYDLVVNSDVDESRSLDVGSDRSTIVWRSIARTRLTCRLSRFATGNSFPNFFQATSRHGQHLILIFAIHKPWRYTHVSE